MPRRTPLPKRAYQPRHLAADPAARRRGSFSTFGVAFAVAAGTSVVAGVASSASAATAPVTRYTVVSVNVRSGPSTAYRVVATLPMMRAVTGTWQANNWFRITSPSSLAGRYIAGSNLTTTAPAATTPLYVAAGDVKVYASTSTSSAKTPQPVGAGHNVVLVNASWAQIRFGALAGKYVRTGDMTTTKPSAPLAASVGSSSRAPIGARVTRWVAGYQSTRTVANVRTGGTTHSPAVATLPFGTAVVGSYVTRDWFRVSDGEFAGRYVNAAQLVGSSDFSQFNGQAPAADLCPLPSTMTTDWEPTTPRYLDCTAVVSLKQMNAAFKARFGYDLTINEGYRDLPKQRFFYAMWGFPRAAHPGTSNHGFGAAIDLGKPLGMANNPWVFGSAADIWLTQNGPEYGWDRPDYLDKTGSNPEFWHYNYVG